MGFFAFNGASCAAFFCPDYTDTGHIVAATALAGATGALTLIFYGRVRGMGWNMQVGLID
jgi:ammonia channel protein AmtB